MNKKIALLILMLGALGYAVYTYWPIVSPYFAPAETGSPVVSRTTVVTTTTAAVITTTMKTELTTTTALPRKERAINLVDPFSLRTAVTSRQEVEEAARRAKERLGDEPAAKKDEPKLEGIWIGSGLKAAFISGQVMTEGGIIMGWRVVGINPNNVVLRKGSAVKVLKLGGEI